jgi:hypothetical protein
LEEARKEMDSFNLDYDGESKTVGDREKLFGDYGERLESTVVAVEEFDDWLP